jgi:glycosyltransferase involved in cell wall biosynthesis
MRILYIHQYFATRKGQTGTRSYEQARRLMAAGHDVVMLTSSACLTDAEIENTGQRTWRGTIDGIEMRVLRIPYRQKMSYPRRIVSFLTFMVRASLAAVAEPNIDIVFASSTPLTVGVPALFCHLCRRVPFLFEVRDLSVDVAVAMGVIRNRMVASVLHLFEKLVYRSARLIVASNEEVARTIEAKTNGSPPVISVPNACDIDLFRPTRDGAAFRHAYGLDDKIVCIHSGAMGPVNGLDAVLDVAQSLREDKRIRFVLIGSGDQKPRLESRIMDEELHNVAIYDSLPKNDLADVLATVDIGLMTVAPVPMLELNCANKFFDYLAAGLPIVLNYQGWQGRVLEQHCCGLSAAQGDREAFRDAIKRLADDEQLRRRMSTNARHAAVTVFSRERVIQPLLDWLKRHDADRSSEGRAA